MLTYSLVDVHMLQKVDSFLQQRSVRYDESTTTAASVVYCDLLRTLPAREFTRYESSNLLPCAVLPGFCPARGGLRCDQCGRRVGIKRKHREVRCGPCNTLFRWRPKDNDFECPDDGRGYGLMDSEGNEI